MGGRLATLLSVVAGALLAAQSRVNGSLTPRLGSAAAVPTAAVSFAVGTLALTVAVLVSGTAGSARSRVAALRAAGTRLPPWLFLGGLGGAALVASTAYAVPRVGVALAAVGTVAGQSLGSLAVDATGIGPGGRHRPTVGRTAAVGVATLGLAVAVVGHGGDLRPGLLLVVAGAGALTSVQAAANGHLQRETGQALVAALASFTVGALVLLLLVGLLLALGAVGPLRLPPPGDALLFAGGLGGAAYIALAATTVRVVGVLRLSLALTAGQLLCGVLLDLVVPTGGGLRAPTVAGAVLAVLAVSVAARATRASARR